MEFDKMSTEGRQSSKKVTKKLVIVSVFIVLAVILSFIVGYLVRRAVHKPTCPENPHTSAGLSLAQKETIWNSIVDEMKAKNIDDNMKYLSKEPHVAGSARNQELAAEIERRFKEYGFDIEKPQYDVLLSYPKTSNPNYAYILDDKKTVKFQTQLREKGIRADEIASKTAVQPFLAFSAAKDVTGDLVYVNYGRDVDFKVLKDHFKVNCTGKIVIARYGGIFRGGKVANAQKNGAIGILIYNDPINYAPGPQIYPNGMWLPGDGVQRGSVNGAGGGDTLSPGWPSTIDAFRLPMSKGKGPPKIPAHPISANDAYHFLSKMSGPAVVFKNWTGGLNVTYRVGPGFASGWKVRVAVNNEFKTVRITNVIGTIRGSVEPDRYVMIGNHRDAWVFGGVDAGSGGSTMLEIARAVGEKMKQGWRPSRSIKFCSWDGEESGLIGSAEYVEQNTKLLVQRAVAYINMDCSVFGNYSLAITSSPLLHGALYDIMKKIKDPLDKSMTMYQKTAKVYPRKSDPTIPKINRLSAGSDHYYFYNMPAVPAVDMMYGMQQLKKKYPGMTFYPVYHSLYDTHYWMKTFIDPGFAIHRAVGELNARLMLKLADAPVIPFGILDYSSALMKGASDVKRILQQGNVKNVSTAYLDKAVASFAKAAKGFQSLLTKVDQSNSLRLRMINDQLNLLEKQFIIPGGLPNRPRIRNMVFSPSSRAPTYSAEGTSAFPGVVDLLYDIEQKKSDLDSLRKHLTIIAASIESAAVSLNQVW